MTASDVSVGLSKDSQNWRIESNLLSMPDEEMTQINDAGALNSRNEFSSTKSADDGWNIRKISNPRYIPQ